MVTNILSRLYQNAWVSLYVIIAKTTNYSHLLNIILHAFPFLYAYIKFKIEEKKVSVEHV